MPPRWLDFFERPPKVVADDRRMGVPERRGQVRDRRAFGDGATSGRHGLMDKLADKIGLKHTTPKNYRRSDERIHEDVCERLWDEPGVDVGEVSVKVKDGVATLEGTVPDRTMKHVIEDIVSAVFGVNELENRLRVSAHDTGRRAGYL
jgi:hypothetical protein